MLLVAHILLTITLPKTHMAKE